MERAFWLERWEKGQTRWQEGAANGLLMRHFAALGLSPGARVLVPLCGASPDIGWLLAQGYGVVGAELSGLAVGQVFEALGMVPEVTGAGRMQRHAAPGVEIFEGDIFDLTAEMLGRVDGIYDRAALFALPPDLRPLYAAHLVGLTGAAPQVLICLEHDGSGGPPFSVTGKEVAALYGDHYRIGLLQSEGTEVFGTGRAAMNHVWHLARG